MSAEDTQKAIRSAYEYLVGALVATGVKPENTSNFRVEEAEMNDKGNFRITLSYEVVGQFAFEREKELKDFEIQPDGKVLWMKIRPKA
ncbi:MAG: hypothetical protein PHV99_00395 [Candidatus Pacebacteria bacterium]|nr:hypothetical protein [Candidatus Paceibacterota bacterium]